MSGTQIAAELRKIETRLPDETLERLKKLAAESHRSVAAQIRVAVETMLDEATT